MRKYLFMLVCLCFATVAMAQQKMVKGVVTATNGETVIGATVQEKGTEIGALTDVNGAYSIHVAPGATLVFSYMGYQPQEIAVGNNTVINVTMAEDNELLEEVVVVGYGVQKKSSLTASVASVSSKEIAKQVTSNVASALQNGGEAGGDVSILIRGAGTFGSTEPLYIVDGAVSNNGINTLNPSDIESIEILKDGSAAAIYGSRAANGVVLVTTKSGKSGRTTVEVNGAFSYQTPSKMLDFMNAEQWRSYANMLADNSGYDRASQNVNPDNPNQSTDWQDIYYQNASMWNLSAASLGGGENSTFSTSVG